MGIYCKELNTTFESKNDLFKQLSINKDMIIASKKAQIIKSCDKGFGEQTIKSRPLDYTKLQEQTKALILDDNYYYLAINSTRILDGHDDLHIDSLWNKSKKEQQGRIYLVDSHIMSMGTTIARKEHIDIFTAIIPFSMIGKNYEGDTEVLIYKVKKDKIRIHDAKEWLDSGDDIEGSIRMQYSTISLALKSDNKEDKKERETYEMYYPIIANKSDFENEILYFWAVIQAKIVSEGSLVLSGSNNATGLISHARKQEPGNHSKKYIQEPPNGTQKTWTDLINEFKF